MYLGSNIALSSTPGPQLCIYRSLRHSKVGDFDPNWVDGGKEDIL